MVDIRLSTVKGEDGMSASHSWTGLPTPLRAILALFFFKRSA
jgi:hypothetical protein